MKPACITLQNGPLRAEIMPQGAALAALYLAGHDRSLVLPFVDAQAATLPPIYAGAIVGPIANRITGATLRIGDADLHLTPNEGTTLLHSGAAGIHARTWDVTAQTGTGVTLRVVLPDGCDGLPGNRTITARYALGDDGTLDLRLRAMSDRDTVMNLAHHPYWNLDDRPDVSAHTLWVAADRYVPCDADTLPTGKIAKVAGSDYDFRQARTVPVDRALDANLCLADARRAAPELAARLTGGTGVTLAIMTTEPGLQVYNGAGLPDRANALRDRALRPFGGIALEPQCWPDAPKNPSFPSIALRAEHRYAQHVRYCLSRDAL